MQSMHYDMGFFFLERECAFAVKVNDHVIASESHGLPLSPSSRLPWHRLLGKAEKKVFKLVSTYSKLNQPRLWP
jgi:hypothetical protein